MKRVLVFYLLSVVLMIGGGVIDATAARWSLRAEARRRLLGPSAILGFTLLASVLLWNLTGAPQFSDFKKAYYQAGLWVQDPVTPLYDKGTGGFVNIPIVAILFTPLTVVNASAAAVIFTAVGLLSLYLFHRHLSLFFDMHGAKRVRAYLLILLNGALFHSLKEGNLTHLLLWPLALVLTLLIQRRDARAGILLGAISILKPPLVLVPTFYLLCGRVRLFVAAMAATGLIAITSVAIFGVQPHLDWYQHCIVPYFGHTVVAYNSQSLPSFLLRLTRSGSLYDWQKYPVPESFDVALKLTLVGTLVGAAYLARKARAQQQPELDHYFLAIGLILSIVFSPIAWSHYFCLLLLLSVPLARFSPSRLRGGSGNLLVAGLALCSLPTVATDAWNRADLGLFPKMAVSTYTLGSLLILIALVGKARTLPPASA